MVETALKDWVFVAYMSSVSQQFVLYTETTLDFWLTGSFSVFLGLFPCAYSGSPSLRGSEPVFHLLRWTVRCLVARGNFPPCLSPLASPTSRRRTSSRTWRIAWQCLRSMTSLTRRLKRYGITCINSVSKKGAVEQEGEECCSDRQCSESWQ